MNKVIQICGYIPLECWLYDLSYRITMKFKVSDIMKEVVVTQITSFRDTVSITGIQTDTHNPCLTRRSNINRFSV
jgi:hypothetical protein